MVHTKVNKKQADKKTKSITIANTQQRNNLTV